MASEPIEPNSDYQSLIHSAQSSRIQPSAITKTAIDDVGIKILSLSRCIERLDLSSTRVGNGGMHAIQRWQQLRYLNICRTEVSGDGLKHLASLGNLESLNLEGMRATDAGLAHLCSLSKLLELKLSDTQISDRSLDLISPTSVFFRGRFIAAKEHKDLKKGQVDSFFGFFRFFRLNLEL